MASSSSTIRSALGELYARVGAHRAAGGAGGDLRLAVEIAGSGGHAFASLLSAPGASALLAQLQAPYATQLVMESAAAGADRAVAEEEPREGQAGGQEEKVGRCGAVSVWTARGMAAKAFADVVALEMRERAASASDGADAGRPTLLPLAVSCTAAVASNRPKKGEHRACLSVRTPFWRQDRFLKLNKGLRDRAGEDELVSRAIVQTVMDATQDTLNTATATATVPANTTITDDSGGKASAEQDETAADVTGAVPDVLSECLDAGDEWVVSERVPTLPALDTLYRGSPATESPLSASISASAPASECVLYLPQDTQHGFVWPWRSNDPSAGALAAAAAARSLVVCSGSFNPVHPGHIELAAAAQQAIGAAAGSLVLFELPAINADKPSIEQDVVRARVEQFAREDVQAMLSGAGITNYAIVVTAKPLFVQKAALFRGCAFAVGSDTAERVLDPKYYNGSDLELNTALAGMATQGCRFVVGGRSTATFPAHTAAQQQESFLTLEEVIQAMGDRLAPVVRDMFVPIPEDGFRVDVSSSELRRQQQARQEQQREEVS